MRDRTSPLACRGSAGRFAVAAALVAVTLVAPGCVTNLQLRERGDAALARGDAPAARDAFGEAVERRPSDWLAQIGLGHAFLELGRPVDAQFAFEKALAVRHDDPAHTPGVLDGIAEALYRQDRPERLYAFLAETTETYGTPRAYLRQAEYLTRLGDADGAVIAYQKAAYFAKRGDAQPYLAMVDFYHAINDQPNAVRALRYAYWVDPDEPTIPDRFRSYGLVPGPTLAVEPPKPELLD